MKRFIRTLHRTLAYLLFVQISLWILGGAVFALLPFDNLVKGGDSVQLLHPPSLSSQQLHRLADRAKDFEQLHNLAALHCAGGTLVQLQAASGSHWLDPDTGQYVERPAAEDVGQFASIIYTGTGTLQEVKFLEQGDSFYLGLVDELYGRGDVWQATFLDSAGTRMYFTGSNGCYLTVRNDYWVLFDALWRLHIMDYGSGEDFNNPLLRIFAVLALVFALSGVALTLLTLARRQSERL